MRYSVFALLTASTMLIAAVVGIPSTAHSQVVIIIGNGSAQPSYPYPYQPQVYAEPTYGYPGYAASSYYQSYYGGYYRTYPYGYYQPYRYWGYRGW